MPPLNEALCEDAGLLPRTVGVQCLTLRPSPLKDECVCVCRHCAVRCVCTGDGKACCRGHHRRGSDQEQEECHFMGGATATPSRRPPGVRSRYPLRRTGGSAGSRGKTMTAWILGTGVATTSGWRNTDGMERKTQVEGAPQPVK